MLSTVAVAVAAATLPPSLPPMQTARALLSTGLSVEYVRQPAGSTRPRRPPVVFVHGSFHAAWCWQRHWMGHFSSALDCDTIALSLRGTAASPPPDDAKAVTVAQHVADLRAFVDDVVIAADADADADADRRPPLIVAHSFGGAYALKYLEAGGAAAAVALLCAVPPSGNGPMTVRYLRRSLRTAWLVTKGLAFKSAARSAAAARALFFDRAMAEAEVEACVAHFAADSRCGLNVADFTRNVPAKAKAEDGTAEWLPGAPPLLVVGGGADVVVDAEGVAETAAFVGVEPLVLEGMPHDMMLCTEWRRAADVVIDWIAGLRVE